MPAEFDIRQHVLVPKHEILSKEKAREVLERYKIFPHQLPLIKSSDPAAKAIGAKPGDILRITRNSPTAGRAIIYRYVIEE
jgi:DNA-directed RNA polymerase subunit H